MQSINSDATKILLLILSFKKSTSNTSNIPIPPRYDIFFGNYLRDDEYHRWIFIAQLEIRNILCLSNVHTSKF